MSGIALIAGGTGALGSSFVSEAIARNYDRVIFTGMESADELSRPDLREFAGTERGLYRQLDVTQPDSVARFQHAIGSTLQGATGSIHVIHNASPFGAGWGNPAKERMHDVHVEGTRRLVGALHEFLAGPDRALAVVGHVLASNGPRYMGLRSDAAHVEAIREQTRLVLSPETEDDQSLMDGIRTFVVTPGLMDSPAFRGHPDMGVYALGVLREASRGHQAYLEAARSVLRHPIPQGTKPGALARSLFERAGVAIPEESFLDRRLNSYPELENAIVRLEVARMIRETPTVQAMAATLLEGAGVLVDTKDVAQTTFDQIASGKQPTEGNLKVYGPNLDGILKYIS